MIVLLFIYEYMAGLKNASIQFEVMHRFQVESNALDFTYQSRTD